MSATTDEKFNAARAALMTVAGEIALHGHLKPEATDQPAEIVAAHNAGVDRAIGFIRNAIKALEVPCGECHLKPGETCDICGRVAPS